VARSFGRRCGLRARLAATIAGLVLFALGATGIAVYRGTGSDIRGRIDGELRRVGQAFAQAVTPAEGTVPSSAMLAAARRYIAAQPFTPSGELLVATAGRRRVTNEPELLHPRTDRDEGPSDRAREAAQATLLRHRPLGYSELDVVDVGRVRLLTLGVRSRGRRIGTVTVGEATAEVARAQHGVARAFAIFGGLALAGALLAGTVLAARLARPLRRLARAAAEIDAGDLARRVDEPDAGPEIHTLAVAFNHMLDRLRSAFARQRGFVADASHELHTPLTVVAGQLEVLARQPEIPADEVRRVTRLVRREVARMQRLIDDLLLLTQGDEEQLVRPQAVSLVPFVEELFEGVQLTADRCFELSPLPDGTLEADPDRVAQALRNVIRNAVEHTEPGGLVRLVATPAGDRLAFAIEDDGPGIPARERERVFDRLHRVDPGRARSAGGSGLGLAIVAAIARAHGGEARAEQAPAGGARVVLELPRWRGAERTLTPATGTSLPSPPYLR
jgi:two-component system OmpR family sensor kinase